MAPNVQDHVADEVNLTREEIERTPQAPVVRHVFQTFEGAGNSEDSSEWKQRIAAMAIAALICTALYGLLYLAMHLQE